MNKRLYIPISILVIALLISGCTFQLVRGSGNVTSETRQVSDFSAVKLEGIGDVIISQEETTSLRIEAEENLIPYIKTEVQGDTLVIGIKGQYMGTNLVPTKRIKYYVSTPEVSEVALAGSGNIITSDVTAKNFKAALLGSGNITNDSLTAASLDINLAGSGNIGFDKVTVDSVSSVIAGSGNITLAGEVHGQTASIVGSGNYRTGSLTSRTATIKVTGSGDSTVSVSDSLNVTILGSGDVTYSGKPRVNTVIAGSGRVTSGD